MDRRQEEEGTTRGRTSFFPFGDDVMVVAGRRVGLFGIVVQVTPRRVVLVDNAGFRHWVQFSEVVHTFGT